MSKRRADADHRRFLDECDCVKIPRLRAMGVVQLDAPHAIIQVGDRQKLIGLAHVRFRNGGSWSLFSARNARVGPIAFGSSRTGRSAAIAARG
jgi:hypothetical protein